jgi:hypothetical protein
MRSLWYVVAYGVTEDDAPLPRKLAEDIALLTDSAAQSRLARFSVDGSRPHVKTGSVGPQQPSRPVPASPSGHLPTRADAPRLRGWHQTIELGNGLVSMGLYDHRSDIDCYGLLNSLRGKTCLDDVR